MAAEPLPLHQAIAAAAEGRIRPSELARRLGVAQPNISRWMRGVYAPSLDDITRIEDACGRPRGWILTAAGYVGELPGKSIVELLERDPHLSDVGRRIVLAAYQSAREVARESRRSVDSGAADAGDDGGGFDEGPDQSP